MQCNLMRLLITQYSLYWRYNVNNKHELWLIHDKLITIDNNHGRYDILGSGWDKYEVCQEWFIYTTGICFCTISNKITAK